MCAEIKRFDIEEANSYCQDIRRILPGYDEIQETTLNLVPFGLENAFRWLDIGCGTGVTLSRGLDRFKKAQAVGVDPSEAMLDAARRTLVSFDERVRLLLGRVLDIYEMEESFDLITTILSLHYTRWEQRRVILDRILHWLAPGGTFIDFEIVRSPVQTVEQTMVRDWYQFQSVQGRTEQERQEHYERYLETVFPMTTTAVVDVLRGVGFRGADVIFKRGKIAGFLACR